MKLIVKSNRFLCYDFNKCPDNIFVIVYKCLKLLVLFCPNRNSTLYKKSVLFLSIWCHQFYTLDTSVFTTEYVSWHIYTNMQFSMSCFILSSRHLYINIVHKHVHSPTLYTMYNTNNVCTVKIVFQKNLFNKLCAKYMTCLFFSLKWFFFFLLSCVCNKNTHLCFVKNKVG